MELREYWAIVRRHWGIVVAVAAVAFIASSVVGLRGAAAYRTDMRIAISTLPVTDPNAELHFDPTYYSNLSSEYLADDMSEFIHSEAFATEVRRELGTQGVNVDVDSVVNSTRTKKTHRFIDVTVTTATPEQGQVLAGSISRIFSDPAHVAQYMKALTAYNTQMTVITPPDTRRNNTIPGLISEIGLRTVIGLLVGIALAFLIDYLDTSVRSRQDAEDVLRLPVLGEIPRAKRGVAA